MKFDFTTNSFADETIVTVRGLGGCKLQEIQEFARIIFVDDLNNYTKRVEDHAPLEDKPAYQSLNITKRVS